MISYMIGVLIMSVIAHELGHVLFFEFALKKKVRFHFYWKSIRQFGWECGNDEDYQDLTKEQYSMLLKTGIVAGLLPIIILSLFFQITLLLLIPYISGCWYDIKKIQENEKDNKTIIDLDEELIGR